MELLDHCWRLFSGSHLAIKIMLFLPLRSVTGTEIRGEYPHPLEVDKKNYPGTNLLIGAKQVYLCEVTAVECHPLKRPGLVSAIQGSR